MRHSLSLLVPRPSLLITGDRQLVIRNPPFTPHNLEFIISLHSLLPLTHGCLGLRGDWFQNPRRRARRAGAGLRTRGRFGKCPSPRRKLPPLLRPPCGPPVKCRGVRLEPNGLRCLALMFWGLCRIASAAGMTIILDHKEKPLRAETIIIRSGPAQIATCKGGGKAFFHRFILRRHFKLPRAFRKFSLPGREEIPGSETRRRRL